MIRARDYRSIYEFKLARPVPEDRCSGYIPKPKHLRCAGCGRVWPKGTQQCPKCHPEPQS
jgi:hypothetical protein